jgi:glycosyltransferase involved in cell wall biosynthesis
MKTLSIIMPAYNEERTILDAVKAVLKVKLPGLKKQIIIVDDGSTDGTGKMLRNLARKNKKLKIIFIPSNKGKGNAIREGIKCVKGDYAVIQDADLEYDPTDYPGLLQPITSGRADVVFGSRFTGRPHRSFLFWNYVANKILNIVANFLYNTLLTDMETCYKMFRSEVLTGLDLKSDGFEIEPEITAKILKKHCRIYEVPINFYARGYSEGKKIKAIDGIRALWALIKYRF